LSFDEAYLTVVKLLFSNYYYYYCNFYEI